ncbi:MAG: hypothetical protein QOF48_128 [Verrucomicrobiota bacterium]
MAQSDVLQGQSVAVDGNLVVVGAPNADTGGTNTGVAKVYDATTGALLLTLANPNPLNSQYFGSAVAISGTRVVVGVWLDNTGANGSGAVYVYDLANAAPTVPVVKLLNPTPGAFDEFGTAVAISGTRIVVGAQGDDFGVGDAGTAYVYDLAGATPTVPVVTLANPTPLSGEYFGLAVAISGTRLIVGAYGERTVDFYVGAAYVYDLLSGSPNTPVYTLRNPTPANGDYFGVSVAISGTRAVVGARFDDTAALNSGSAYVYELAGPTPTTPVLSLSRPNPVGNEFFGISVSMSGPRIVVAAHRDNTGATNAGAAFVFDLSSATPSIPILTLTNPTPAAQDVFGRSVSISGDRVVVGAPMDDTRAADAGSAYLYDLAGALPAVPAATLDAPEPRLAGGDQFGISVSVSGTRLVVGAYWNDTGASNAGSAYVYDLASATPALPILVLTNPSPALDDWFGFAVSISGTRVVVGAHQDDRGAFNAGMAYVYDLASAIPEVPVLTLTNPSPAAGDVFGYSVAISGSRLVIGAPFDDTGAANTGSAYVYDLNFATPAVPVVTLNNPGPATADLFGWSVAISGGRIVVGANSDDTGGVNAGSAYVYDVTSLTPSVPVAVLNNPYPAFDDRFGSAVAISGPRVVVGAPRDDAGATDAGSAYVYDLTNPTPTLPVATLTNVSPAVSNLFGFAVAISGTRVVVGAYSFDAGPIDSGIAYVYDIAGATPAVPIATLNDPSPATGDQFGLSVAIDGPTIVAGAPYDDTSAPDRGVAYVFGSPRILKVVPGASGLATLSWTPATASGFMLQYTDSLAPTNWVNAPSGAANPVMVSTTNASRFYRLFQP